ncbi:UNVERIFIED_CONTAM: hypothetical protein Sangu_2636100 [Sesamum angustifolium]|uniref:Uncharacterized protein n=1 Tax=Sesamum angustifolium TaxID=2727405 RepID=A0AAW2J2Z7_9LAMI
MVGGCLSVSVFFSTRNIAFNALPLLPLPGRPLLSINGHRTLTPYSPSFLGSRHHNRSSVPPSRNQNLTRNRQSQLEDHKTWERE